MYSLLILLVFLSGKICKALNIQQANKGNYHQDHRKAFENNFGEELKLILLHIKIRDYKIKGVDLSEGAMPSLDADLEGKADKIKV